eukprot:1973756-Rhodomonas_salina.2
MTAYGIACVGSCLGGVPELEDTLSGTIGRAQRRYLIFAQQELQCGELALPLFSWTLCNAEIHRDTDTDTTASDRHITQTHQTDTDTDTDTDSDRHGGLVRMTTERGVWMCLGVRGRGET